MSDVTFLELDEGVGVESDFVHKHDKHGAFLPNEKAGDPGPLRSVGIHIPFPAMVGNDVIEEQRTAEIVPLDKIDEDWKARPVNDETQKIACARIIPGTRVIETNAPPIVAALLGSHWHICDPPAKDTKARQAAGKASDGKAGE
jgi:hypothetical protein